MTKNDWVDQLPRTLRVRFEGIGKYTSSVLEEADLIKNLSRGSIGDIQTIAFLKSFDKFLQDGSDAATQAVDAFAALGVNGFRVGSEVFEGRNAAVTRGARLAAQLRAAVKDEQIRSLLESDKSLREIIVTMGTRFANSR